MLGILALAAHAVASLCAEAHRIDSEDLHAAGVEALSGLWAAWDACLATAEGASSADVQYNYGNCRERWDGSGGAAFARAVAIDPRHAAAHYNHGLSAYDDGNIELARRNFAAAFRLRPLDADAAAMLGAAESDAGNDAAALVAFNHALRLRPDDATSLRLRSALVSASDAAPDTAASFEYVAELFDAYSPSYESDMAALAHRTPQLIAAALRAALDADTDAPLRAPLRSIVDLGCGTGLALDALASSAHAHARRGSAAVMYQCGAPGARVVGVDASARMLSLARAKRCAGWDAADAPLYTVLLRDDYVRALAAMQRDSVDLIVASDSLNYGGDLAPVLGAARAALRCGARFAFSLEAASGAGAASTTSTNDGFALQKTGRYVHERVYVERAARRAGFVVSSQSDFDVSRIERGVPVRALIVVLRQCAVAEGCRCAMPP